MLGNQQGVPVMQTGGDEFPTCRTFFRQPKIPTLVQDGRLPSARGDVVGVHLALQPERQAVSHLLGRLTVDSPAPDLRALRECAALLQTEEDLVR